jgi:hypothetical protein
MPPLQLSYAAFSYHLKKHLGESGELSKHGKGHVSLLQRGKDHSFQLFSDDTKMDCGYIYTYEGAITSLFRDNLELVRDLLTKCRRGKEEVVSWENLRHCSIKGTHLQNNIQTCVKGEDREVNCLYWDK